MKRLFLLFLFVALTIGAKPVVNAAPDSKEKVAVCTVCGNTQDAPPVPVGATANYKGQTYSFCSKDCRAVFLKTPQRFLESDIGQPAPAFTLKDWQGKAIALDDFKGKVILLDFWASWCPICRALFPRLQAQQTQYADKGFSVVGVVVNSEPKEIDQTLQAAKLNYPIPVGTDAMAEAYKIIRLPTMLLIGRDGRILKRFGPAADAKTINAEIEKALAAK